MRRKFAQAMPMGPQSQVKRKPKPTIASMFSTTVVSHRRSRFCTLSASPPVVVKTSTRGTRQRT